jgi:hypothetical protein
LKHFLRTGSIGAAHAFRSRGSDRSRFPVTAKSALLTNRRRVAAHFKRMQERPSVKKLFAYEREVNEGFAKTA